MNCKVNMASVTGGEKTVSPTDKNEKMITERGAMAWMSPNMEMTTSTNGIGKAIARTFSGESLFQNIYCTKQGNGLAFVEIDGSVVEYQLAAGESIVPDTGYLAAMSESCKLKVETVPGLKNKFFGGEGFFNTIVTGPGHVWIQTMPANKMAGALRPYIPNGD